VSSSGGSSFPRVPPVPVLACTLPYNDMLHVLEYSYLHQSTRRDHLVSGFLGFCICTAAPAGARHVLGVTAIGIVIVVEEEGGVASVTVLRRTVRRRATRTPVVSRQARRRRPAHGKSAGSRTRMGMGRGHTGPVPAWRCVPVLPARQKASSILYVGASGPVRTCPRTCRWPDQAWRISRGSMWVLVGGDSDGTCCAHCTCSGRHGHIA